MAKITPRALAHAKRMRSSSATAKKRSRRNPDFDDELGDGIGDILGGLPIIGGLFGGSGGGAMDPLGSLLGGLLGGGSKSAPASSGGGGAMGPAPGMLGMPMPGGGPTIEQIRSIVQDALAGNRDIVERMQLQGAGGQQQLQKATDAVTQAIAPQLAQARGGVQVQRLQTQATSEHKSMTAATDRERLATTRHQELLARLNTIAQTASDMQARLGGGSAVITNPTARNILNVR